MSYYRNSIDKRIAVFEDTMQIIKENERLCTSVRNSISGTKLYTADEYPDISVPNDKKCIVSVTGERTFESAKRLGAEYADKKIAVLNFASAVNPGGGVEYGASAQEEALCRCSTLFPCLKTDYLWQNFYKMHRERHDTLYTDSCIYTPEVTAFKSDTLFPETLPESKWHTADVLTCAAPNLYSIFISDDELYELHIKRIRHILTIAAANGAKVLVLGAFGCGAFINNPLVVAKAFKDVLQDYSGYFTAIVFAIYCPPDNDNNYKIFSSEIK